MNEYKPAWAVRPYPHDIYRMQEFLQDAMAAIGWPATGDLTGCDREAIRKRLKQSYYASASPQSLGQATGIFQRFVNDISQGDAIVVPDGADVYFGVAASGYTFKPQLQEKGYAHWIMVDYKLGARPVWRSDLPAVLFDALKGRQTVFSLPPGPVWEVITRYAPGPDDALGKAKAEYTERLAQGTVAGINSPKFEDAVKRVLSFYYPNLRRLATSAGPVGGDTDLETSLPGDLVVRVQVKCYQDRSGPLGTEPVRQLRTSMNAGEYGILVTTGTVGEGAREEARRDREKPIGFISGADFADLVFENMGDLSDSDLRALGLARHLAVR